MCCRRQQRQCRISGLVATAGRRLCGLRKSSKSNGARSDETPGRSQSRRRKYWRGGGGVRSCSFGGYRPLRVPSPPKTTLLPFLLARSSPLPHCPKRPLLRQTHSTTTTEKVKGPHHQHLHHSSSCSCSGSSSSESHTPNSACSPSSRGYQLGALRAKQPAPAPARARAHSRRRRT